jgi:hypothetical protein
LLAIDEVLGAAEADERDGGWGLAGSHADMVRRE